MKIDNEFTVDAPIERAWAVLTDLETIAPCMPGAQLTGVEGDVYSGKVRIKVGPVVAQYAGTVTFREKNDEAHEATIDASGRDARGAGTASAAITAKMREEGGRTTVTVDTDLKITGKLAQFGRGMIQEVSSKLLGQFVDCLQGKLAEGDGTEPATDTAAEAAATPATGAAASESGSAPADGAGSAPAPEAPATAAPEAASTSERPSSGTGSVPEATAATETAPAPGPAAPAEAAAATATEAAASATGQAEQPQSASATRTDTGTDAEEPAPLDLMSVAGSSIYKRLVPLIIVVAIIVVAVIIYLVAT